jgi:hypothetical protein
MSEWSKLIEAAKQDFERAAGGNSGRGLAGQVEQIGISTAAKVIEALIADVPAIGGPAAAIADPLIEDLASKLEAWVNSKVDAKLAALGNAGTVQATGLGAIAAPATPAAPEPPKATP